jgi:hypothetical protein
MTTQPTPTRTRKGVFKWLFGAPTAALAGAVCDIMTVKACFAVAVFNTLNASRSVKQASTSTRQNYVQYGAGSTTYENERLQPKTFRQHCRR